MRQRSIGEVLAATRESRGYTLMEMQRETRIQAKYLQALEYNDFEFIPDKQYTRTFLKRYANALDLDSDVLLDAYETNSLVEYYEAGEEADFHTPLRSEREKKKRGSYLPLVYLLLAALSIFCFVGYIVHQRIQETSHKKTEPSSYKLASSTTSVTSSQKATTSSTTTSSPKVNNRLTVTGGGNNLAVQVKKTGAPVQVTLSVTDVTSWISLTDTELAGGVVLSPENKAVTVTIPEGVKSTTLTLGVVQGVTITIAGEKLNTSSLTAQPSTVNLSLE